MGEPDLLVSGIIHTLDPERPTVEALLARGGRIVRIGDLLGCRRAARPGAVRLETRRGCAVPGLADAHGHVVLHARSLQEIRCHGTRDERECAQRVAWRARAVPPGTWLRGRGWDENRWEGGALPSVGTLSSAVPNHPVVLERADGHASWVNARALAIAGIGASTPDPPGGRIHRGRDGEPTGILVDAAQELVTAHIPHPTIDEQVELIVNGLKDLARYGLTAVHDAGCTPTALQAYRRLAELGELPLRVYAMIDGAQSDGALEAELARWAQQHCIGLLDVRAVKLFADGALGSRGAALLDGYADDPGNRGILFMDDDTLRSRLTRIVNAGFQPAVHAIGDAACRQVIGAYSALSAAGAPSSLRPRVEHLQLVRAGDLARLRGANAIASMQPSHAVSDAAWVARRVGEGTPALRGAYAWRQVLRSRTPLAFGSDFPVESPDPRLGLFAAEARRPAESETPWTPAERIERAEALRAFTHGVAFAAFAEERRGTLREGADADLTLFGEDLLRVDVDDLPSLPLAATVVAGRVVQGDV